MFSAPRLRALLFGAAFLTALLPAAAVAAPSARLAINAATLTPAYSLAVSDYTVRCGQPVAVSVNASPGIKVALDGADARSGSFTRTISLTPGQAFRIKVVSSRRRPAQTVRCLPADFPLWQVEKRGDPQAQWYMISPDMRILGGPLPWIGEPYAAVVNGDGVPVWWFRDPVAGPMDVKLVGSNQIAWALFAYDEPSRVRNLDGTVARELHPTVGVFDFHEAMGSAADGGALLVGGVPRNCPVVQSECVDLSPWGGPAEANILDNVIQKFDRNGRLVWSWSTRGHIAPEEAIRWIPHRSGAIGPRVMAGGQLAYDIFHVNSVVEQGNGVIFTARHLDAAYRVRKSTGRIDWKLGGTPRAESLAIRPDPGPLGGPHDFRILSDGTMTIHDNGSFLGRSSRALRFSVKAGTAKIIETVRDSRVKASLCCGSARRMPGGNWVMTSGGGSNWVTELTSKGRPVLTLTMPQELFTYRADAIEPGRLSAAALRAGMDAQAPR
ncbi:MAG: hypothetical protein F2813_08275 [Actinobacteria bacterium]|uniref:Unannotated protein n=1 Tax=freshwater metagenome TaxID=449393 RepID=A0A6J6A0C3_9ZZZZ|nr:hypothetical protein [Actinomycetota bacterium]